MSDKFRFAVIGTGDIAQYYLKCFFARENRENIEFAGAWNRTAEKAARYVENFGGRHYAALEELLADPSVDAVVNLTTALAHEELTEKSLLAGKHVLTEKPLALSVEKARELIALADRQGKRLTSAPFILLGQNQRKVKDLIDKYRIGKPVSATAELYHGRVELWHPSPQQFYMEGAGPVLDVGPYPVSLMVYWFGPVESVQAVMDIGIPTRKDLQGNSFSVSVYDHGFALLSFVNGVIGRIAFSMANSNTDHHGLEIQGTEGSLALSSFFEPDGLLKVSNKDSDKWDEIEGREKPSEVDWAGGIYELARSLREGRKALNSDELAFHTLQVLLAINKAADRGIKVEIQ